MIRFIKKYGTVIIIALGFAILYLKFKQPTLLYIGVGLLIPSLISPKINQIVSEYWIKLGKFLGTITSTIILTIIFFLILTPISLLYRLFNKDPLDIKKKETNSYFYTRNHSFTAEDLKNPW